MLLRFWKIAFEKYNQYKIEYIYSISMSLPQILFLPLMWYFLTDGGSATLLGWKFHSLVSIGIVYGIVLSVLDLIGYWDVWMWFANEGRVLLSTILTKPVNPLLYIYGLNFFPGGFIKLLIMLSALYVLTLHGLTITPQFVLMVIIGILIIINVANIFLAMFVAFDKEANALNRLFWSFLRYGDLPVTSLSGTLGFVLTFIIPVAFVGAVPSTVLELKDYSYILPGIVMALVTFILSIIIWKFALRRFEAVGG